MHVVSEQELAELLSSHDALRGALIFAARRIQKLTFGRRNDPALDPLRHALKEARQVSNKLRHKRRATVEGFRIKIG